MIYRHKTLTDNSLLLAITVLFLVGAMLFLAAGDLMAATHDDHCEDVCEDENESKTDCEDNCDDCNDCIRCLRIIVSTQIIQLNLSLNNPPLNSSTPRLSLVVEKPISTDIYHPPKILS